MKKIVTFGEIMLRLSTPGLSRVVQANSFNATYGGGEANVAVSLAQLGMKTEHVTRFPDNALGKAATNQLRQFGVETKNIIFGGDRMGLYFLETGAGSRASNIIYDRYNSSFAHLDEDMINWETVLEGAQWFHWTGITPAISEGAAKNCIKALSIAHEMGITISADINYRRNLWKYGKKAAEVMPQLIDKCDVIVASPGDADDILGIRPDSNDINPEVSVFKQIMERFPKLKKIINTTRDSVNASHNKLYGNLYDGNKLFVTHTYDIYPIVDRIGGGDAFMAGFIYGQINYKDDQKALDFAVAASVLKHTIENDANLASVAEVEKIMNGDLSGKLLR